MRLVLVPGPSSSAFAGMDPTRSTFHDLSWQSTECRPHSSRGVQLQHQHQHQERHEQQRYEQQLAQHHHNHVHLCEGQCRDQQRPVPTRSLFRPYQRSILDSSSPPAAPRGGRLPSITALLNWSRLHNDEALARPASQSQALVPGSYTSLARLVPTFVTQQRVRPIGETLIGGIGVKRTRQEDRARVSKKPRSSSLANLENYSRGTGRKEGATTTGKQSRYLREMDRRSILERLAHGERQADLAKEFHVSRAAICNLNKHRDAVLSRQNEHPLAKHPKRRGYKKTKSAAKHSQ